MMKAKKIMLNSIKYSSLYQQNYYLTVKEGGQTDFRKTARSGCGQRMKKVSLVSSRKGKMRERAKTRVAKMLKTQVLPGDLKNI